MSEYEAILTVEAKNYETYGSISSAKSIAHELRRPRIDFGQFDYTNNGKTYMPNTDDSLTKNSGYSNLKVGLQST